MFLRISMTAVCKNMDIVECDIVYLSEDKKSKKGTVTLNTINHYTLNTGNMVESYVQDTDREIYFTMKKIINRAKRKETELIDGTYIKIVEEPRGYICTLYGKRGRNYIPILSTAGTKSPDGRNYIWKEMEYLAHAEMGEKYISRVPVDVPYIVDYIHMTSVLFPDVFEWTGSFARCVGWMMLYPEEVRETL